MLVDLKVTSSSPHMGNFHPGDPATGSTQKQLTPTQQSNMDFPLHASHSQATRSATSMLEGELCGNSVLQIHKLQTTTLATA